MSFIIEQHGWAMGVEDTILVTDNGGKTWTTPEYRRYPALWYWLLCIGVLAITFIALRTSRTAAEKAETIADLLVSDRFLKTGDPDPLHFADIARGLSRFIRNPRTETPLTIAVTGEWGTGKSSLMNLLYEDLKEKGFSTVWFNAAAEAKGPEHAGCTIHRGKTDVGMGAERQSSGIERWHRDPSIRQRPSRTGIAYCRERSGSDDGHRSSACIFSTHEAKRLFDERPAKQRKGLETNANTRV